MNIHLPVTRQPSGAAGSRAQQEQVVRFAQISHEASSKRVRFLTPLLTTFVLK